MENFKKIVSVTFFVVSAVCAIMSLGYALCTMEISLTVVSSFLIGLAILLGLRKLLYVKTGIALKSGHIIFLCTMTVLQYPIDATIPTSLPLWKVAFLGIALWVYILKIKQYWDIPNSCYKLNSTFMSIIMTLTYLSSIITLIDGIWSLTADLAAVSVLCYHVAYVKGLK